MTCPVCGDRGIVRLKYHDGSPDAYGVCRCDIGQRFRVATNNGKPVAPQWLVWASRNGVDPATVAMVEDLLDEDELTRIPRTSPPAVAHHEAIVAAMTTTRRDRR